MRLWKKDVLTLIVDGFLNCFVSIMLPLCFAEANLLAESPLGFSSAIYFKKAAENRISELALLLS